MKRTMAFWRGEREELRNEMSDLKRQIIYLKGRIQNINLILDDWDDRSRFFANDGIDYITRRLMTA